jgi:hypothetical protein
MLKNETVTEFNAWFAEQELGALEAHREMVSICALNNAGDPEVEDQINCAKSTVTMYLDNPAEFVESNTIGAAA